MMEKYFEQAPCLYFSTDDDGSLLEVNEQLCITLNYSKDELQNKRADLFYTVPTRIFHQTHFFPLLKLQGYAEEIYITLKKRNDEQLPVLMNAARKMFEGKAVCIYTGIIVRNRKKFEEELISARKTAEAALNENTFLLQVKQELQKRSEELDNQVQIATKQMEELKQFNHVATHDMQEPLRKLSMFSNMLVENTGRQDQTILIDKIRRITLQMKDIISGLQQYVWLNQTPLKITGIYLDKILMLVKQQLEEEFVGVNLIIKTENTQSFLADEEQMRLLFYHLLSNAIRFRKKDSEVNVDITVDTIQLNQFRNVKEKYKYVDFLRIRVADDGIGFDPEYKMMVFELFRRLHKESGRGVGLSLCKKIVEQHGGSIHMDSEEGKGTVVIVLLPLNPPGVLAEEHATEITSGSLNLKETS